MGRPLRLHCFVHPLFVGDNKKGCILRSTAQFVRFAVVFIIRNMSRDNARSGGVLFLPRGIGNFPGKGCHPKRGCGKTERTTT
jgi:hypothetical protein